MNPSGLLYAVETEILKSIVSSLGRGAVGTAEWQADRLRRLGIITEKSSEMVAAYRARVLAGFDDEVERAAIEAALEVDARAALAAKAGADVKDLLAAVNDPTLRATIATWQASARDQANLAMAQLAQNAGTVYSDIVSKTALSVVTGATDGRKALVQTIREWSAQGIPSIVDKAGRQWTSEAYVNAVLRSNTSRAANESALARAEEYDTDLVEVSSHPGSRPSHFGYQGHVYSRSGTSAKYPALAETGYGDAAGIGGVNCVAGDTIVLGPAPRAAFRREYSGEIIIIRTANGNELSVTPNHPILTNKGWIAANRLAVGDNVISRSGFDRSVDTTPNPNDGIPTIEEIFDSLLNRGNVLRLPASACNFHGDIPDHEVDIVFVDSLLRDGRKAALDEHIVKDALHDASELSGSLLPGGPLDKVGVGSLHSSDGLVGWFRSISAPFFTAFFVNVLHRGRTAISKRDAEPCKESSDPALANPKSVGDFILPHSRIVHGKKIVGSDPGLSEKIVLPISGSMDSATIETIRDCIEGATILSSESRSGNAGTIQLDNIVSIERKTAQGSLVHVYNLQTESGWYFSNNIISHNCSHILYPFWEGVSISRGPTQTAAENEALYAESQNQRALERSIRSAKRELSVMESLGDADGIKAAKATVRDRQAQMREFIEETGRTRRSGREQIYDQKI